MLEPAASGDRASRTVDTCLILLILANVMAAILETVAEIKSAYAPQLLWFEYISVGIFTLEYFLRIWSCTAAGLSSIRGRLGFMARPMLLIDLAAILPAFLIFMGIDLRMIRIVRLIRFFRIFKMARYSRAMQLLGRGLGARREELLMSLLLGVFAMIITATFMYFAEREAQPEIFSSIPAAFWWAVTTLTTVGYGDAYPITLLGKILGGIAQVIGVGVFAIPTGIMASAFLEQMEQENRETLTGNCPRCGRPSEGHGE